MKNKKQKICCICKKKFEGFGNNPYPLKEKGRCCDKCDNEVIATRISQHFSALGKKSWAVRKQKVLKGLGALISKNKGRRQK